MTVRTPGITVFPAPTADAAPAVLILPGGSYNEHSEQEGRGIAEWVTGLGFHAVVLKYPVAPARHPAALNAARTALGWLRRGADELHVDRTRVGVIGSSAGGHLAASLATGLGDPDTERPDVAVLCYPVISFEHDPHVASMQNLFGPMPPLTSRHELSADTKVDSRTPPTFLWHTAADLDVHVSHSLRFAEALNREGIPVDLHIFAEGPHGLGTAASHPDVAQWTALCERWLRTFGGN